MNSSARFVGTYRNPKTGGIARIVSTDGKLTLKSIGGSFVMHPVSATEFKLDDFDVRIRFLPTDSGKPRRIEMLGAGLNEPPLEQVTPFTPSPTALRDFAGEYASDELNSTYRIGLEKGNLVLHARNLPATPLEPTIRDEFEYPSYGLALHFTRRSGRINGFTLASGLTQGIRFERRPATSSPAPPHAR